MFSEDQEDMWDILAQSKNLRKTKEALRILIQAHKGMNGKLSFRSRKASGYYKHQWK